MDINLDHVLRKMYTFIITRKHTTNNSAKI